MDLDSPPDLSNVLERSPDPSESENEGSLAGNSLNETPSASDLSSILQEDSLDSSPNSGNSSDTEIIDTDDAIQQIIQDSNSRVNLIPGDRRDTLLVETNVPPNTGNGNTAGDGNAE